MRVRSTGGPHRPPRLLLVHRYFWPDTPPYAVMLRAIAAHWAEAGHDVEVLSSQPSYKPETALEPAPSAERIDGFRIRRLSMRSDRGGALRRPWNMLRFSLLAFLQVLVGPRREFVMCSTVPQVTLGWAVSWAARLRRTPFVYHCMDLHPEIGRLSGEFARPWVYRALMRLDVATCRRAAAVVVLSDDMRAAVVSRDAELGGRVVVLNNFDLPEYGGGTDASVVPQLSGHHLTVAFTGNLGRFQGLETIVEAVLSEDAAMDRVRLVLMGDGAAKPALTQLVAAAPAERQYRVVLLPHGTTGQARAVMRVADWGLVSLTPGVIRYAYPSKTATYLSEGLPVLAAVEPDSALVSDLVAAGVGHHLPVDSPESVARALVQLADASHDGQRTVRAREIWRREFALDGRLARWDDLLAEVIRGSLHEAGVEA